MATRPFMETKHGFYVLGLSLGAFSFVCVCFAPYEEVTPVGIWCAGASIVAATSSLCILFAAFMADE